MVDTSTSYSKRLKQVYDWEQGWDTPGYNSAIPFNNDYWADLAPFMNVSFDGGKILGVHPFAPPPVFKGG